MLELCSLRGKNALVIGSMRRRIEQEQREFDSSMAKIHAVRSVHLKLLGEIFEQLGVKALKGQLADLVGLLHQKGLKLGVRKQYEVTFERLRATLAQVDISAAEIQVMLGGTFRELNAEFGFSLQAPVAPQLDKFKADLARIEHGHFQYLGAAIALKLVQSEFSARLARALALRLRTVYESAANDLEFWSKSATAQLDAQLRERRRSFARRMEVVDRIQQAAGGLEERIAEIEEGEMLLGQLEQRVQELTAQLMSLPPETDAQEPHCSSMALA
jgi:DNA anti-recombination protein RmuC